MVAWLVFLMAIVPSVFGHPTIQRPAAKWGPPVATADPIFNQTISAGTQTLVISAPTSAVFSPSAGVSIPMPFRRPVGRHAIRQWGPTSYATTPLQHITRPAGTQTLALVAPSAVVAGAGQSIAAGANRLSLVAPTATLHRGDPALLQARSNVARSGVVTRNGYYRPRVIVRLGGVDVTSQVEQRSLRVSLVRNDEPDTASFAIKLGGSVTPSAGQTVTISLGSVDNEIFAGQVQGVRSTRVLGVDGSEYIDVRCQDWTQLFDRRRINKLYRSESASEIARHIIATYTTGFFPYRVAYSLPTIDSFPLTNERPSEALRRLANLIGGSFYIDTDKVVHLWGQGAEPWQSHPPALTNTPDAKAFSHESDHSQVRTRVYAEGMRTRVPIAVPEGPSMGAVLSILPLDNSEGFKTGNNLTNTFARLGHERIQYTFLLVTGATGGENPPGTVTRTDTVAGATLIEVDSVQFLEDQLLWNGGPNAIQTEFVRIGDQIIRHEGYGYSSGNPSVNASISNIPTSGYGSIGAPIPAGVPVQPLATMIINPTLGFAHPKDEELVFYVQRDDVAAQAALSAIEGGDGIHEHVVSDARLDEAGLIELADSELNYFKAALTRAHWETFNLNAMPGRSQVFNLTSPGFTRTLQIERVELSWGDLVQYHPRRRCEAGTVKVKRVADLLVGGDFDAD